MVTLMQRLVPGAFAVAALAALVSLTGCGGLVGGGLGSLVGSGTGRTVATVVGALGGAYAGNRIEKSQGQVVYQIGVKYDDGSWVTIRQAAPAGLRIGDRVRVTDQGVELLR